MNRFKNDTERFGYVKDNKLIVTHSSGFFSCCTLRLRKIIFYYNKYGIMPIVDSSQQWSTYKDVPGDITHTLFNTVNIDFDSIRHVEYSTDTVEDQFSDFSKINYNEVSTFIRRYFGISDHIKNIETQLLDKYNINVNNTIAVCYRGSDKRTETNVPTYEEMLERIHIIKQQNPNHSILLQTDEIEFLNTVKLRIPDIITIEETVKVTRNNRAVQFYISMGQRLSTAMIFLAVMQILSKCDHVILNSGNVGMWVCLFRNNTQNVSQYLDTGWIK